MFESLSDRLQGVLAKLKGKGRLTEADVDAAVREVRIALLEADVSFKVVKRFVADVRERAVGADVMESLTPGQMVVKIVLDELTALMGGAQARLVLGSRIPNVIMLVGLQGSGKTTASAKLARLLAKEGRHPLLAACDVYRPAAVDQLVTLGAELDVPVFTGDGADPVGIAQAAVKDAVARLCDVVIVDTAGRLHVDEAMMDEAARIKAAVKPDQVLMVIDAMTGQDAVNAATAFAERVDFDGVIVSKLDGDARGGAALSVKAVTGKPIMYVGVGEKLDALEAFYPDRMAKRILGMGDVVTLIEKAQETVQTQLDTDTEARLREGRITLDDFLGQLRQLKKMGSVSDLLGMVPGMAGRIPKDAKLDEGALTRTEAIIQSMTVAEREKPSVINGRRRERIATGSGTTVYEVNQLLKQFSEMQKLVKQMRNVSKGSKRRRRGMPGMPGMRLPF